MCFQRLLYWIHNEFCPNFFIPENNMFAGKIIAQARVKLISYLVPMYYEGYRCLLRCPSFQNELLTLINQPLLGIQMELMAESDKCEEECELITEMWNRKPLCLFTDTIDTYHTLQDLDLLISENEDPINHSVLRIWRISSLQDAVICLPCILYSENKIVDKNRKLHLNMVTNLHVDNTRHLLYAAVYHYRCGMYKTVLRLLDNAKWKLQHPQLLYPWHRSTDKYRAAGGDRKPLTQMMTEIVAWPIALKQNIDIPELVPEHNSAAQISLDLLLIPPLVLVNF